MKILIVEDDYLQACWLTGVLEEHLPLAEIRVIPTELEFREAMKNLRVQPPDLVILDVMLRWTDPAPDMVPAPPDVRESGFFRAGFRCERLLRQYLETEETAVILYTVLEEGDIQQTDVGFDLKRLHGKTRYINKDSDPSHLLDVVKEMLSETVGS